MDDGGSLGEDQGVGDIAGDEHVLGGKAGQRPLGVRAHQQHCAHAQSGGRFGSKRMKVAGRMDAPAAQGEDKRRWARGQEVGQGRRQAGRIAPFAVVEGEAGDLAAGGRVGRQRAQHTGE